jgi:hypothetical protein
MFFLLDQKEPKNQGSKKFTTNLIAGLSWQAANF